MKHTLATLTLIIATLFTTQAQADLYLEADPITYGLNGHSLHLGIQGGGFRFQIGAFNAEYPDSFKDNENFDVTQGGYGFKIDYYGKNPEGGFIGIEYGATTAKYQLKTGGEEIEQDVRLLGIRTGYKMKIGKSLYVMPWIGVDKNLSDTEPVSIGSEEYQVSEWVVFPTVHVGFYF